jgi:hypothetical protein
VNNMVRMRRFALPIATVSCLALCSPTGAAVAQAVKAAVANTQSGGGHGGTGRQGDGQPLRVMVMHNGAPVANAHVAISVSDGSVVLRGVTKATGVFVTTSLDTGTYTVTATKVKSNATSPVTITQSTDPAVVSLTLQ